ncbi:hypothetical protein [Gluconobacter morbifer]|uniref:Phage protein n=1 Tax=Gluconobacter morbifer G707 TaxID=1088869 RepID=G6XIS0_9PROT|nr:hypothetical protein [Gluconobacter morbifer]EHH68378.1 hypothetical protein GMO_11480 [Gluconobacter morbifer G707]
MNFESYELAAPISFEGGQIQTLSIQEPDALKLCNAQRAIEVDANPEAMSIFARDIVVACCGISSKVADLLPLGVTAAISDLVMTTIMAEVDGFEFDPSQDTIELNPPVNVGTIGYSELYVRSATTGEMIKANSNLRNSQGPASDLKYRMSLVSQVCGIPITTVHKFPASTVYKTAKVIEVFTNDGRGTGNS